MVGKATVTINAFQIDACVVTIKRKIYMAAYGNNLVFHNVDYYYYYQSLKK